jgi:hypothetical protein
MRHMKEKGITVGSYTQPLPEVDEVNNFYFINNASY